MPPRIRIDPIQSESDRTDAISLLSEGFPNTPWWPEVIGKFNLNEKTKGGLLLKIDGASQGVMLLFEHERLVQNKNTRFVNISSWYVRKNCRNFTNAILKEAIKDEHAIYAVFTPSPAVLRRCLAVGFRLISDEAILSLPFRNDRGTGGKASIKLLKHKANCSSLSATDIPLAVNDHSELPFVAMEVRSTEHDSLAIVIFRLVLRRGIRFSRLIYTSNSDLTIASLGSIKYFLLRKNLCFGIYLPKSCGYQSLRNYFPNIASPSILVKGSLSDADVDLLYSEYLYLPI